MAGKAALAFRRMLTGGFHTAGSKHTGASDPNRSWAAPGKCRLPELLVLYLPTTRMTV